MICDICSTPLSPLSEVEHRFKLCWVCLRLKKSNEKEHTEDVSNYSHFKEFDQ